MYSKQTGHSSSSLRASRRSEAAVSIRLEDKQKVTRLKEKIILKMTVNIVNSDRHKGGTYMSNMKKCLTAVEI